MLLSVLCFIVSVCISGWFVCLCVYFLWAMLPDTNIYLSIYLSILHLLIISHTASQRNKTMVRTARVVIVDSEAGCIVVVGDVLSLHDPEASIAM